MSKHSLYILSFVVLGILVSFLVHAAIEIPVVKLLVTDFERYGLGLTWGQWFLIHHVGAIILLVLGAWLGYKQGHYWWRVIYIKKKHWWTKNLKKT